MLERLRRITSPLIRLFPARWRYPENFAMFSHLVWSDIQERGEGRLYVLTGSGARPPHAQAEKMHGPFWGDDGLPYAHIRLPAYVAPFTFAHVDKIRAMMQRSEMLASVPLPGSTSVSQFLLERSFGALLVISQNTPQTLAEILMRMKDGEQITERVSRENETPDNIWSGESNPCYYAWREGDILVVDVGAYDQGT